MSRARRPAKIRPLGVALPYYWEVYRRLPKLRPFWEQKVGPGTVPCDSSYEALTPLGRRVVLCGLRRHEGRHWALSGGIPLYW